MVLTIEEKNVLYAFFRRHGLFHSENHRHSLLCLLWQIERQEPADSLPNTAEDCACFAAVIKRNVRVKELLTELRADWQRWQMVKQNSENTKLSQAQLAKFFQSRQKLMQLFIKALSS